eukprot:TRINITY_DN8767_c0_g1_i1.p2 TRINITY_DN8767_c0_g1~~TRINITY_DN8767_c0_g1_i1.p2  ORF type:complete len:160 (+),score=58.34 TRINITY_DN8767_c0_g1_i1:55-480(+)
MAPPMHVKIISGATGGLMAVYGLRDILLPETSILPNDTALNEWCGRTVSDWGSVQKAFGCFGLFNGLARLVTVFSTPKGTFLRRNLFCALALHDLVAAIVYTCINSECKKNGADLTPFILFHFAEAASFLFDVFTRERQVK